MKKPSLIAFDYDGTLAQTNSSVSERERDALKYLGDKGILRVIATGRSLFSVDEVMDKDLPVDYIVFSSGVGVIDWKNRDILKFASLESENAKMVSQFLINNGLSFMLHHPVPDNHYFHYYQTGNIIPDFRRRIDRYKQYAIDFSDLQEYNDVSQLLVITEKNRLDIYEKIKSEFENLNVVRTTSPLDHESIWIEIFPGKVSKASGIEFLAQKYGIGRNEIVTIGNDFNDIDMLNFCDNSFVVQNAHSDLKKEFECLDCNGGTVAENLISKMKL